ncbi:hypothetical protein V1264_020618 [Littorina saxatilis]|uniref:Uncharacterized protein n=1 Tax=Littorina saxatilis TaxID=31220 RepID=A0AAN9GCE1_9CAEN
MLSSVLKPLRLVGRLQGCADCILEAIDSQDVKGPGVRGHNAVVTNPILGILARPMFSLSGTAESPRN